MNNIPDVFTEYFIQNSSTGGWLYYNFVKKDWDWGHHAASYASVFTREIAQQFVDAWGSDKVEIVTRERLPIFFTKIYFD